MESSNLQAESRIIAVNAAAERYHPVRDFDGFIQECGRRFIEQQLDRFPLLCEVTRIQNRLKQQRLAAEGIAGRFTPTVGWSPHHLFKFDYDIPRELYLFMINLVSRDFWASTQQKIWRRFMRKIVAGDDPMATLIWAKQHYGSDGT